MDKNKLFTVGDLCRLTSVNRLELFRFEKGGLLLPTGRMNNAGYKLYSTDDLELLWKILFLKELGEKPASIKKLIENPNLDLCAYLQQRFEIVWKEINNLVMEEVIIQELINHTNSKNNPHPQYDFEELTKHIRERKNETWK